MSLAYLFDSNIQFQDKSGNNNVNGFLRVYIDNTDDRAVTYKDFNGTLNQADIRLDNNGRAVVIVDDSKTYRLEVYGTTGVLLWTLYPISPKATGINETLEALVAAVKSHTIAIEGLALGKKNKQQAKVISGTPTQTVKSITQNADGEISVEFEDIDFPYNINISSPDDSIEVGTPVVDPERKVETIPLSVKRPGLVKADSEDTEPGTLIDKMEVVDNVSDPEDPPVLQLQTTVDGQGNRKVALNVDNLRSFIGNVDDIFQGIFDVLDSMDFDEVPHGSFGSSLNQSPGDGTTTSIQVSIFRPLETTVGDAIAWTKTTEIGGEDFGTVTLGPGTYIICSDITCQWVGVPAGTYLPQVGNVLGEPFDFSQQQELHRRMTNVVTVSAPTQFKMRISFDAATPVMGFWINSAQIVKIAGGMSQTNVTHDSTLTGQGSVADPLGVNTQNVAQSTLAGNLAPAFDPNRTNENPYIADVDFCVKDGVLYAFKNDHYGAWRASDVRSASVDEWLKIINSCFATSANTINLFDGNFDESGYIDPVTGEDAAGANFKRTSRFYEIDDATATEMYYIASASSLTICILFYDSTKTYISNINDSNVTSFNGAIPSTAKYFRVYTRATFEGSVCISTTYTSIVVPYVQAYKLLAKLGSGTVSKKNLDRDLSENITTVENAFSQKHTLNLFDGNFDESGYIDPGTGADAVGSNFKRTSRFYEIGSATAFLYYLATASSITMVICFYDSSKSYLYHTDLSNSTASTILMSGKERFFRMYTRSTFDGSICISRTHTTSIVPYSSFTVSTITPSDKTVSRSSLDSSLSSFDNIMSDIEDDLLLNYSTGAVTADNFYRTSNFISVVAGTNYFFGVYDASNSPTSEVHEIIICFYDENCDFLSGKSVRNYEDLHTNCTWRDGLLMFTVPANAVYAKVCVRDSPMPYKWKFATVLGSSKLFTAYSDIEQKNLNLNLMLQGKQIACFGDSIIGNTQNRTSVPAAVRLACGATVYNFGFGGCRMSVHATGWDNCSMYRLADDIYNNDFSGLVSAVTDGWTDMPTYFPKTAARLAAVDFSKIDCIVISYGTNDYRAETSVLDNADNLYDTSTVCGALRYSIKKIQEAYPDITTLVTSPIYRMFLDDNHDVEYESDTKDWGSGTLIEYAEAFKNVCKQMKVEFLDLYNSCGLNLNTRPYFYPETDGTHPNENGRKRLGTLIGNYIKTIV